MYAKIQTATELLYVLFLELTDRETRNGPTKCECWICKVGRATLPPIPTFPRIYSVPEIENDSWKVDIGQQPIKQVNRCGDCFQVTGRGIVHKCSRLSSQKNLASEIMSLSPISRG